MLCFMRRELTPAERAELRIVVRLFLSLQSGRFWLWVTRQVDTFLRTALALQKFSVFLNNGIGNRASLSFTSAFGGRLAAAHKHVNKVAVRDMYLAGSAREPGAGNELRSPTGVACTPRFSQEVRYRVPSSSPYPAAPLAA